MAKNSDSNVFNFNFKDIKEEMKGISEGMAEAYAEAMVNSTDSAAKKAKSIAEEIEKLRQDGMLKSEAQQKEFFEAIMAEEATAKIKLQAEVEQRAAKAQTALINAERNRELEKFKTQQEALRAASAASKKEHEWQVQHIKNQNKYLEAENKAEQLKDKLAKARSAKKKAELAEEIKLLEKQAKEDKRKSLQEEKQHEREQKKQQAADDLSSYSPGDVFKDAFLQAAVEKENMEAAKQKTADENLMKTMQGVGKAITEGLNAINNSIKSYASHQTAINARLQGIGKHPYQEAVEKLEAVAFSPLLKAEDLYSNLADLVGQGIATNVEQRAFFETTKEGIAQTFDVTNDSLRRIIRLQREDSTAARLGLEAYLNRFLNTYVESTEYLTSTFDSVASSLFEASAMLGKVAGAGASAEFEYVVQKWLGTLVGLGFSESTAQSIADALGQLGSGDVSSLAGSNMQNLLVMAANKMNKSYADMLLQGLNATDANDLMKGIVLYLQELGTYGTNVVKNQLSGIFGVTVSDLIAVSNLSGENAKNLDTVYNDLLSVNAMYDELKDQYDKLPGRVGIANILDNLFANLNYQTGQSIGSNPALFATWKITDLINSVTGGINIPHLTAVGTGIGFEATVENLIKLGIVGISTLGNIGKIISGVSSVGDGSALLNKLSITSGVGKVETFGKSLSGDRSSGKDLTEVSYAGNTDSEVYAESAVNEATDDANKDLEDLKKKEGNPMQKTEDILADIYAEVSTIAMLTLLANRDSGSLSYDPGVSLAGIQLSPAKLGFSIGETLFDNKLKYDLEFDADAISKLFEQSGLGLNIAELIAGNQMESTGGSSNTSTPSSSPSNSGADSSGQGSSTNSSSSAILDEIAAINQVLNTNFETLFQKLDDKDIITQTSNDNITIITNQYDFITSELTTIKTSTDKLKEASDVNMQILTEIKESAIGPFDTITPGIMSNENSAYLASMEFASNFNNLVSDVAKIAKKYLENGVSNPPSNLGNTGENSGNLNGFTQYEF